jgi:hypothetical protein
MKTITICLPDKEVAMLSYLQRKGRLFRDIEGLVPSLIGNELESRR